MDRRAFLIASSAMAAFHNIAVAQGDVNDDVRLVGTLPPLPEDLAASASQPPAPYTGTEFVGTAPPSVAEINRAYEILLNSPIGVAPIDVAQYFLAVGAGAYGEENRIFVREWPIRANPLIFHFFSSTQTSPAGDTTAWCAAFVNWCLLRSRAETLDEIGKPPGSFSKGGKPFNSKNMKEHSTNNASSGSFRCLEQITDPQRGDIVVFKDAGTDELTKVCRGSGHVAFYLGNPGGGWVRVLGGNQSLKGSNGAVTVADMRTGVGSRFFKYVRFT